MPQTVTVKQGECLASLADAHGFRDWRTIYDHPDNAELREARPDPNHLLPGDRIVIPDKGERIETRMTSSRHRFVLSSPKTQLRLRLDELEPVRYRLTVAEVVAEGSGSMIDVDIPASATHAELEIWLEDGVEEPHLTWAFDLGHIDPHVSPSGGAGRLRNLGYGSADAEGSMAEPVRAFQRESSKPVTGELDDVLEELRAYHDVDRE